MAVGRFQVMALLQAARAYTLGLPLESAHSWGLNRAIFYAAAKRGFRGTEKAAATSRSDHGSKAAKPREASREYYLGEELAYRDQKSSETKPMFVIGGKSQTDDDFKRQIEARFQPSSFREAWKEALDYVGRFERSTLESQNGFFSEVYRPKRDEFARKWTEAGSATKRP